VSAFIGKVKGPRHNSPHDAVDVWCSLNAVAFNVFEQCNYDLESRRIDVSVSLDPIAARNLAALLVRASEEAERMAARTVDKEPQ
jgi:hypothetical protein